MGKYSHCKDFNAVQHTSNLDYVFVALCDTENAKSKLVMIQSKILNGTIQTLYQLYDVALDAKYDQIGTHTIDNNDLIIFLRNAVTKTLEVHVVAMNTSQNITMLYKQSIQKA